MDVDRLETVAFLEGRPEQAAATATVLRTAETTEPIEALTAPSAAPAPPVPPQLAPPPHAAAPQIDDLYEQVIERLRRELLVERERMGDLLGDLP